jgi:hypothetical protein
MYLLHIVPTGVISQARTYDLQVLGTAGLIENQPNARIFDQSSEDDQISPLVLGILVAQRATVSASKQPATPSLSVTLHSATRA